MAAKKTTTTSASKTKSTKTRKPTKPKSETQQSQANLDEALVEKKPAKPKKLVKQKTAQEELYDMVQAVETGKAIGQAAIDSPIIGFALAFGVGVTVWNHCKQKQQERDDWDE